MRLSWWTIALGLLLATELSRAAVGVDAGQDAAHFAPIAATAGRDWWAGDWVRLRGMSGLPAPTAAEDPRFQGLAALRQMGIRPIVWFSPEASWWFHGTRPTGGGQALPLDLGEAYTYAERLALDAWPNVAAWEIGNEPDLIWSADNPETYAAYLKAVALGLRDGSRNAAAAAWRPTWPRNPHPPPAAPSSPLILPGALALTPGPYLEQLAANDFFSYIDGFNWHFYGYAEDFTAQYRQFETAVGELAGGRAHDLAAAGVRIRSRELPVFLTEYGYSLMSGPAAATVEGRVRQWRWFQSVTTQMQTLRVAAPVAFYLPPYLEAGFNEFGLTMPPGSPNFVPADFGLTAAEPWMARIGAPIGDNRASPALAWLAAQPAPSRSHDWTVTAAEPSPVVLDFIAGDDLQPMKSWQGYLLKPGTGKDRTGGGELRIYNFSPQTVTGRLTVPAVPGLTTTLLPPGDSTLTLAPMAFVRVPVRLRLTAKELRTWQWEVTFAADHDRVPPSALATKFLPNAASMTKETTYSFSASAESAQDNRELLLARPTATAEPRLHVAGDWLVSDGLSVEKSSDGWQFRIAALPSQPLRPAMAELPLPKNFQFSPNQLLMFEHRLLAAPAGMTAMDFDCYFRTANGNLCEVLPRLLATRDGQVYAQAAENFTGMSFARMNLPWRFADNTCVALVFFFRPKALPVTIEIRHAELARFKVQ